MADKKKKRKKLKAKKTGAGDPTLRLKIEIIDMDDESLVENVPVNISVNVNDESQPILDLPSLSLPTVEPIVIMVGFTGLIEASSEGDLTPLKTVLTATSTQNPDYDLTLEDDTGLESTVEQQYIAYENITYLEGVSAPLPNLSEIVFQSREDEGNPTGDVGIYVFLKIGNSNTIITDNYFVSNQLNSIWVVERIANNIFTILNKETQQFLGYDGNLTWYPTGTTGTNIEWYIESAPGGGFPYSIQSVKADADNATNTYLTAIPTVVDGNVQLAALPSPWYLHIDIFL